jgi:hypothetical protein
MQTMFSKAKGGALPENQIKMKKDDDETFERVSGLFDKMQRRSRYGTSTSSRINNDINSSFNKVQSSITKDSYRF